MASTATSIPAPAPSFPLTGGRRAALLVGVPVCLALVAATGFSLIGTFGVGRYAVSYAVPAGTKALTLNVDGQLTIRSATAGQATLIGTAKYSLAPSKVTESTRGGATTFGYRCPIPTGDCELDATAAVPATVTTLTVNSGSGDEAVAGINGPVKLSTGDGNLSVGHMSGPLTLNTGSGSIAVSDSEPPTLSVSSGNGDIQADKVTSTTVTANTDSGSISGSFTRTGTISASSGNGDIQITLTSVPGNVRLNTNSGNIELFLPPGGTRYHFTANSLSGSVSYPTALQSTSSQHVITATSGSGNILITQK
jgi:Putative adhesin